MASVHSFYGALLSSPAYSGDRFGRRLMYRFVSLAFWVAGLIPVAILLFVSLSVSGGMDNDQNRFMSFTWPRVIWAVCTWQAVGAAIVYYMNQYRMALFDPPNALARTDDRITMILIVGATCFSDGLVTSTQFQRLCWGEIGRDTGFGMGLVGSGWLFTMYLDVRDQDSNSGNNKKSDPSFWDILVMFSCALPMAAWYYLFRTVHRTWCRGRRGPVSSLSEAYGSVADTEGMDEDEEMRAGMDDNDDDESPNPQSQDRSLELT